MATSYLTFLTNNTIFVSAHMDEVMVGMINSQSSVI